MEASEENHLDILQSEGKLHVSYEEAGRSERESILLVAVALLLKIYEL